MAKKKAPKREEIHSDLATKTIYHYINDDQGIDIKCREVFKNKKEIRHYPFGRDGSPKYKDIRFFKFVGFDENKSLPVGINKSPLYGLGFTKVMSPLFEVILEKYKINEVHIFKTGKVSLTAKTLTLTESVLKKLHPVFQHIIDVQRQDRLDLASEKLAEMFPAKFTVAKKKFLRNSVHLALDHWTQDIDEFSQKDRTSIKDLFDKLVLAGDFLSSDTLLTTKSNIDKQYIEDVIADYKKMMGQKNESASLEKKWQDFLGKHNWVFSYVFSFPILLVQKEAYVGGKNISNANGKVTDFLVKNSLTNNVAFLEIKTHKTELIGTKKAYRGNDVFPMSKDLTGGITQVLNQRDNFQKEFYAHKAKSEEQLETVNSKCLVLMGSVTNLNKGELKSFELFRTNSRDVEIIGFDELLSRFEKIKDLIEK